MEDSSRKGQRPEQPVPAVQGKQPYEPPRVLTDEAFEQISLACMMKFGSKKNFT